ncbi:MAG: cupin domain-containing protein [Bacteroidales bacterium]|nr:cupin domain-containing protein [Bacteroidales bacterium]
MKALHVSEVEKNQNPHGVEARMFHDNEFAQAVYLVLQPGEQLKRHSTPVDVFFYVLEGTGIVEIGEEKLEVSKDTYIDSPAKIPHCWYNESTEVLRILVVKTPRPTNPTRIL